MWPSKWGWGWKCACLFVYKQDVDWACGHMGGAGGRNVRICVFANRMNRMWTGRVAKWVGVGMGVCMLVCL